MNVYTRGVRNAFRNGIRTTAIVLIIGLTIGLALAMLVARQAVSQKIESVKSSIGNTVSISPAGIRGLQGGGTPLTTVQLGKVASIAHVTTLTETLNDRLDSSTTSLQSAIDAGSFGQRQVRFEQRNLTPGEAGGPGSSATNERFDPATFKLPVTVIGTDDPGALNDELGGGSVKLTSGVMIDGNKDASVAMIGSAVASKNNLKAGSTFTAYGATFTVSGIFDAGNTFANAQIIMPLPTVQRLSGQPDSVTRASAKVDSISNLGSVVNDIQDTLGSTADVTSSQDTVNQAIQPLESIQNVSLYSLVGAIIAGATIILLTMIMIVRERRREVGVLKAIGASNIKIMVQYMSEAVTFTILAAIIGIMLGVVAANPMTKLLVNNSASSTQNTPSSRGGTQALQGGSGTRGGPAVFRNIGLNTTNIRNIRTVVDWHIVVYGLGSALLIALIGSGVASYFIAKIRPAEVMRAE